MELDEKQLAEKYKLEAEKFDAIWDKKISPEYAFCLNCSGKEPIWKDKLRIRIARFIYWLSSLIGDKNG